MGIDYQKIVLVNFGMIYLTLVKLIIFVTFCVQHQRAYPSAGWAAAAKSKSRRAAAKPTPLSWAIAKKTSSQTCSGKSIRELGINPIERLVHSYGGAVPGRLSTHPVGWQHQQLQDMVQRNDRLVTVLLLLFHLDS